MIPIWSLISRLLGVWWALFYRIWLPGYWGSIREWHGFVMFRFSCFSYLPTIFSIMFFCNSFTSIHNHYENAASGCQVNCTVNQTFIFQLRLHSNTAHCIELKKLRSIKLNNHQRLWYWSICYIFILKSQCGTSCTSVMHNKLQLLNYLHASMWQK